MKKNKLSVIIRARMKDREMKISDLAEKLGESRASVWRWVKGISNPRECNTLIKLVKLLNIDLREIETDE